MKIVVDTSSLLSLEFMDILEDTFGIAEVHITSTVEEELREIASYKDEKSHSAKKILKLVHEGKIKCVNIENKSFSKYISRSVDAEEASCVAVLMELIKSGKISRSTAKVNLSILDGKILAGQFLASYYKR